MKLFQCQSCGQPLVFENTTCVKCGSALGYLSDRHVLSTLVADGDYQKALAEPAGRYRYCENFEQGACNWLVPAGRPVAVSFCEACTLNRTIPDLSDPGLRQAWRDLEGAKHRLVYTLLRLALPLKSKGENPEGGLAFDFLSGNAPAPAGGGVQTGHSHGLITIDVAEADPAHRERVRTEMGESYRTLVGHLRHEVGHYYWERLVQTDRDTLVASRDLFGDERADYAAALQSHYRQGPPAGWNQRFLSAYASAHPWEDWAECWAHYLHLIDTLETAYVFGLRTDPKLDGVAPLRTRVDFDPYRQPDFDAILTAYLPLTFAVNSLNRSMGQPDLYPFVLPPPVIDKLRFVHGVVQGAR